MRSVARQIESLYSEFSLATDDDFADFHVRVRPVSGVRRWARPQVQFDLDGQVPFKPLPAKQAYAMLEWGLNWCVSNHAHRFLILHAAVIESGGRAALLPAPPGSGKSTLTAALVLRGWRLLSDELALIDLETGLLWAMPRPVNLKNAAIEVIRQFEPTAVIGEVVADTHKGTVGHLKTPTASIVRMQEPARPAWVVFPKWQAGQATRLEPLGKARACLRLAEQGFNYSLLGSIAFNALTTLLDGCECYEFGYSVLDEAIEQFSVLAASPHASAG